MIRTIVRTSTAPISLDKLLEGQLKYLSDYYKVIAVSGESEELRKVEKREKVKVFPIDMKRRISPVKDLISLFKLCVYLKREKPQIVHSITPKAGLLSMLAAKFAGVPVRIHTFTGLFFPTQKGGMKHLLIAMDKLLCWAATDIIPEGKGVKNDLETYKITKKQLMVLANGNVNGIDTSYFNPENYTQQQNQAFRKLLGIQEKDFVFVFVGRLVSDKGINELIQAFKSLSIGEKTKKSKSLFLGEGFRERPLRLLLVGPQEPELDPLLPETLAELKSNPNIIAVGFQEDVRPYFAISDALAFPSYREGFPNVVMQAGAMGLPSIVSDINGCNEIIVNGKNGVIVPAKSISGLQQAMQKLSAGKSSFYDQLKSNSRPMIESRFRNETVWQALVSFYDQALQRQKQKIRLRL